MEPISGAVADAVGLRGMFLMFGVLTLVTGPAILWLWNRAEMSETDVAPAGAIEAQEQEQTPEIVAV
jgi:hypothetical protein